MDANMTITNLQTDHIPETREVASGMKNLGNTCYMNAVLQALAHAPELCHAIDSLPHHSICPIAIQNYKEEQKKKLQEEQQKKKKKQIEDKGSGNDNDNNNNNNSNSKEGAANNTNKSPPSQGHDGTKKKNSRRKKMDMLLETGVFTGTFCTLCEFEKHIIRVHQSGSNHTNNNNPDIDTSSSTSKSKSKSKSNTTSSSSSSSSSSFGSTLESNHNNNHNTQTTVAPTNFVRGFITDVAPSFKLGVQEDSHEFLRLLIDAMQTSCQKSKAMILESKQKHSKSHENTNNNTNDDDDADADADADARNQNDNDKKDKIKEEYPFQLFQGTIQSSVKCNACQESNITYETFEDIGLEVTPPTQQSTSKRHYSSSPVPQIISATTNSDNTISNNNNNNNNNNKLADVPSALEQFTRMENLDSQYKCEKCHALGSATKVSRLARIPPILTLHLKRFRYGQHSPTTSSIGIGNTYNNLSNYTTSLKGKGIGIGMGIGIGGGGTSGSAKIEGHVRFDQFFDIRPFLTPELQQKHQKMFCRLFAVIVHTGKNSHSGHYISYVRNLAKNEWWMMDDATIMRVSTEEVVNSEAYMLFYRVVDHPVASMLKTKAVERRKQTKLLWKERQQLLLLEKQQKKKEDEKSIKSNMETKERNKVEDKLKSDSIKKESNKKNENDGNKERTNFSMERNKKNSQSNDDKNDSTKPVSKKRDRPKYEDGYEWAKKRMKMPNALAPFIHRITDKISDGVEFKFDYFKFIMDEVNAGGKIGSGPSGVSADDVQDGCDVYRKVIRKVLHRIFQDSRFQLPKDDDIKIHDEEKGDSEKRKDKGDKNESIPDHGKIETSVASDDDIDMDFQNLIPVVEANDALL